MLTRTPRLSIGHVLAATAIACTLLAGGVAAQGAAVTVYVKVSTQGVDPHQATGAAELYNRLQDAAKIVCGNERWVSLQPAPDPKACFESSLAHAIRAAHLPLLTLAYLQTHTRDQALAFGIEVPAQLAAGLR